MPRWDPCVQMPVSQSDQTRIDCLLQEATHMLPWRKCIRKIAHCFSSWWQIVSCTVRLSSIFLTVFLGLAICRHRRRTRWRSCPPCRQVRQDREFQLNTCCVMQHVGQRLGRSLQSRRYWRFSFRQPSAFDDCMTFAQSKMCTIAWNFPSLFPEFSEVKLIQSRRLSGGNQCLRLDGIDHRLYVINYTQDSNSWNSTNVIVEKHVQPCEISLALLTSATLGVMRSKWTCFPQICRREENRTSGKFYTINPSDVEASWSDRRSALCRTAGCTPPLMPFDSQGARLRRNCIRLSSAPPIANTLQCILAIVLEDILMWCTPWICRSQDSQV